MERAIEVGRWLIPARSSSTEFTDAPETERLNSHPKGGQASPAEIVVTSITRLPELGRDGRWSGTATQLFRQLTLLCSGAEADSPGWPRAPNHSRRSYAGQRRSWRPVESPSMSAMYTGEGDHPNQNRHTTVTTVTTVTGAFRA